MKRAASDSPFAQRMMEKPKPESLNTEVNARFFLDPPEIIQLSFGGWVWFVEMGITRVHRVGLFRGIGWELDLETRRNNPIEATGVKIVRHGQIGMKFNMFFMKRVVPDDHLDPMDITILDQRLQLPLADLKKVYAEVLGEASI